MEKLKFTKSQTIKAIKEMKRGFLLMILAESVGDSNGTFSTCRKKYAGMKTQPPKCLSELEEDKRRPK